MINPFRLTFRTILIWFSSLTLIALIVGYIIFQGRFLIAGPQIVLAEEPPSHNNVRMLTLSGQAFNITHLYLNGRQIFTDEAGHFREALVLENGYTITTLKARDRFGRETRVERSFVFTPAALI